MTDGDKVLWKCRPGVMIPAVVAEVSLTRVKIRINQPNGKRIERWVDPGKVVPAER